MFLEVPLLGPVGAESALGTQAGRRGQSHCLQCVVTWLLGPPASVGAALGSGSRKSGEAAHAS